MLRQVILQPNAKGKMCIPIYMAPCMFYWFKYFIFTPNRICYNFIFLAFLEANPSLTSFVILGEFLLL